MDEHDILDGRCLVSFDDLCRVCGVERDWAQELADHGVITPAQDVASYSVLSIMRITKARRLQQTFDLNTQGIALALDLLDEIDRLRARLARQG